MDPSSMPAAGSRPQKQTIDQAPQTRQSNQTRSDIFGVTNSTIQQTPSRQVNRPKTDIFAPQEQVPRTADIRKNNTNQSSIFAIDNNPTNTHYKQSQTYERSTKEVKTHQAKNTDNRLVDHGKEYLFGKSDFDEYKSLKRAQTLSEFKPKLDYDPANRRNQELYGNEIARDHLPTKPVKLENGQNKQKPQKDIDQDASTRKQIENSSTIFGESPVKRQSNKIDKLTPSTQKWSNVGGQSKNDVQEFDPDTYAKNRKEKELESTLFTDGDQKQKIQKKPEVPKQQQQQQQQPKQQQQKPKERLIPNNQTWAQTDSVKNMKDFNPTQSQVEGSGDPNQKKQDTLKSTLDTHQYEPQQIPANEKISNKLLKNQKDIIARDDKTKKKQPVKKAKQDDII